jgi:hypothetical protein
MKLPRVQFTVRLLMITVAAVATVLAGWLWILDLGRLSTAYRQKDVAHTNQERRVRQQLRWLTDPRFAPEPQRHLRSIVLQEAVADHHRSWAGRYRRAAARPWEAVSPEPPPPTWETHELGLAPAIVARAIALNVTSMDLGDAGVTDDLLERIGRCHRLRSLNLYGNPITDAGLIHLKGLTDLSQLRLSQTRITDRGLIHLAGLSNLHSLDLYRTRITKVGLSGLTTALPRTVVTVNPDL